MLVVIEAVADLCKHAVRWDRSAMTHTVIRIVSKYAHTFVHTYNSVSRTPFLSFAFNCTSCDAYQILLLQCVSVNVIVCHCVLEFMLQVSLTRCAHRQAICDHRPAGGQCDSCSTHSHAWRSLTKCVASFLPTLQYMFLAARNML